LNSPFIFPIPNHKRKGYKKREKRENPPLTNIEKGTGKESRKKTLLHPPFPPSFYLLT
jgi:hypothetical protein